MDSTPQYGEVIRTERLSPSLQRVILGGVGLEHFEPSAASDSYVNVLFPPPDATYTVPFDIDAARELPPEQRPRGRRYTIRGFDVSTGEVTIDFVVHGDVGFAGAWVNRAQPGDLLQFVGPSGGYRPSADAPWHLLVGDESALPAIAVTIERIAPGTPAVAIVVVDGPGCEIELTSPGDLEVVWLYRRDRADDGGSCAEALVAQLASLDWFEGLPDVFVHGEAEEVRAVRRYLIADRGVPREGASISPYWRRGHDDEAWRQVKRQFVAEMEAEG